MNSEVPVLKFDYGLRNDYCKPIIDCGKNLIITPLPMTSIALLMIFRFVFRRLVKSFQPKEKNEKKKEEAE